MNRSHQLRIPVRYAGVGDTRRRGLERVLVGVDGVLPTSVNATPGTAYLDVDPAHVDVNAVARAIVDSGDRPGRPVLDQQDRPRGPKSNASGSDPEHRGETATMHEHHTKPQATDPVCGMPVPHDSEIVEEYRGTSYRFCDPACAETFRTAPERWVGPRDQAGFTHSHQH